MTARTCTNVDTPEAFSGERAAERVSQRIRWLRKPDGNLHGWDDDETIFEYFEKLADV